MKVECSDRERDLKKQTKTMQKTNKHLKWIENQLVENRSNQERLRATIESNNCNGDTEELAEEENGEEVEDPSGAWIVDLDDGYATYELEWDISKSGQGVWNIDQTLRDTTHSHHKKYIDKKQHSYTLTSKDGSYKFEGASSNTDPGGPGAFYSGRHPVFFG